MSGLMSGIMSGLMSGLMSGNVRANVWANVRDNVGANVWDNVWVNVWDNVRANVGANVRDNVWDNVWDNVGANVGANVRANVRDNELKYESFAAYGSISDYGWVSFYDFFTQVGVLNHDGFNKFKDLLLSGIYDMIQLEGVCIVCELPKVIKRNAQGRLHSASGSAIKWSDGYEIFYWNGVSVPEKWIMKPNEITRDEILKEDNAEKRRCLREIIGAKEYYDIITDGEGMNLIDEDIDNQGFPMKLYQTKSNDSIIGKKVMVLEVTCPSTNRIYNLYPPNQSSKNVWEAKASTFNNESLQFRHGDVGLKNIETNFVTPIMET